MKLIVIGLLILLVVVEIIGETSLTKASKLSNINNNHQKYFLIGVGITLYALVGVILYFLLVKQKQLIVVNTLWQVINVIFITLIGIFYFNEKLSVYQIIALILAIISIILINKK